MTALFTLYEKMFDLKYYYIFYITEENDTHYKLLRAASNKAYNLVYRRLIAAVIECI